MQTLETVVYACTAFNTVLFVVGVLWVRKELGHTLRVPLQRDTPQMAVGNANHSITHFMDQLKRRG